MSRRIGTGISIVLLLLALAMLACQAAPESAEEPDVVTAAPATVEQPQAELERVTLWSWAYNDYEVWALETLSERALDAQQLEVELTYVR